MATSFLLVHLPGFQPGLVPPQVKPMGDLQSIQFQEPAADRTIRLLLDALSPKHSSAPTR